MNIQYRPLSSADYSIVTALIWKLYEEDPTVWGMSDEKIQRTFGALEQHPDKGVFLVFEKGSDIIGYSLLINYWSNEFGGNIVHVDEIYVKAVFRGQGVATNFIKHLIESKFGDAVALKLEVTARNQKARALYERLGFKLHKNDTLTLAL